MMTFVEMAQMLYNEMYEVGPHDHIDEWDCMGMYEVMMEAAKQLDKEHEEKQHGNRYSKI